MPLNIACIGAGYWGKNYLRLCSNLNNVNLSYVCELDETLLANARKEYPKIIGTSNLSDMISDINVDAVIVATPATAHFSVVKQCLLGGKHVLCEKPLTTNSIEGEELVALAKEKNLTLMVGHTFIYNSRVHLLKQRMDDAESFGQLHYLYSKRTNMGPIRRDCGAIWDLAPHDISIFQYLLNDVMPLQVSATGMSILPGEFEDIGFITLFYPDSKTAHIHVSWIDPHKERELVIVGSKERLAFDDTNNNEPIRIFMKGVSAGFSETNGSAVTLMRDGDILSPKVKMMEPLKDQVIHFVDCVVNNKKPLSDGSSGVAVTKILEAALRSVALRGVPVSL